MYIVAIFFEKNKRHILHNFGTKKLWSLFITLFYTLYNFIIMVLVN